MLEASFLQVPERLVEFRHLYYFVTVAEELSVTRAALKLRLAQPSLTRQVRNLEEKLKVRLFHRANNKLTLTEAGRFFLERTRCLLTQASADVQDLRRLALGESGTLSIGYIADMHSDLLTTTLGAFRSVWPDVSLNLFDLSVAEQFQALGANRIDLCFVGEARWPAEAGLRNEMVMNGEALAVLPQSNPLAQKETLALQALAEQPFITMGETFYPGARAWLQRVCAAAGFAPRIAHEVDRTPTMISLVALGMGVTLLPEPCRKLPHTGAVFRPLAQPVKTRIDVFWKEQNLSRPLQRFIQIARAHFAASL